MSITPYSFCMSLVWFSAFVFVADRLYRKTGFLLHYRMGLLLFLVGLSALRLFLPMEVGWTKTFSSYVIFPWIQDTLTTPFTVWGVYLTPLRLLMVIWFTGSLLLTAYGKAYQGTPLSVCSAGQCCAGTRYTVLFCNSASGGSPTEAMPCRRFFLRPCAHDYRNSAPHHSVASFGDRAIRPAASSHFTP